MRAGGAWQRPPGGSGRFCRAGTGGAEEGAGLCQQAGAEGGGHWDLRPPPEDGGDGAGSKRCRPGSQEAPDEERLRAGCGGIAAGG